MFAGSEGDVRKRIEVDGLLGLIANRQFGGQEIAFTGLTEAYIEILHGCLRRIHFHQLHANQGAQFADAFQTQLQLEG